MYNVLILGLLFWFLVIYPKYMCKSLEIFFLVKLGAPRKKQWCCFFRGVPCAQHFETIKCTGYSYSKLKAFFSLGTFGAPLKKQQYCSFHGAPCMYHFQSRKCLESCLLILYDSSCPNSMFKTYLFCWFSYDNSYPNSMFKFHVPYIKHFQCAMSVLILDCWFYFVISYPNSTCKTFLFSKL